MDCLLALEILLLSVEYITATETKPQAYCRSEHFEAECEGGVIMMKSAEYGRMRNSRCVSSSYNVGCYVDVLYYFDQKCSGRRACKVYVSDPELHTQKPCNDKDLSNYLEASYHCQKVAVGSVERCNVYGELLLQPTTQGYISSDVTVKQYPLGSHICPWVIRVPQGQRIKLTLYTSGSGKVPMNENGGQKVTKSEQPCSHLGSITEAGNPEPIRFTQCGTGSQRAREHVMYESASEEVQVSLLSGDVLSDLWPFLIKYEATGCPPLNIPAGAHKVIDVGEAVVKCNSSGETWFLTCGDKGWIGEIGNCSTMKKSSVAKGSNFLNINNGKFPVGILLIVALGVALGVFLGGILLTLAAVHMRKKQKTRKARSPDELYNTYHGYEQRDNKVTLNHEPYYDTDITTATHGEYEHSPQCPTHGYKHQSVLHADLIPTLPQSEESVRNAPYEPTMHRHSPLKHGHLYEKTNATRTGT